MEQRLAQSSGQHERRSGGRRELGIEKAAVKGSPLISVVTVVFNRAADLQQTIDSVQAQTYENIEHIIVDGGSTDGTLQVIKLNEEKIDYWISEPDNGIYDAMNKAIDQIRGSWVNFMNCGDRFASPDVVKKFVDRKSYADIVYGDALVEHWEYNVLFPRQPLKNMWRKSPFCHQAAFIDAVLMKTWKYNLKYRIGADHDFFFKAYVSNKKFEYTGELVCLFDGRAGATRKNIMRATHDLFNSTLSHQFRIGRWVYSRFFLIYMRGLLLLRALLGEKLIGHINKRRKKTVNHPVR